MAEPTTTPDTATAAAPDKAPPGTFRRRRSGTAAWHMSLKAVTTTLKDLYGMSAEDAHEFMVLTRFGS